MAMNKILKENDMGDRMMLGLPYGTGGVVNPGVGNEPPFGTSGTDAVGVNGKSYYQNGPNLMYNYNNDKATGVDPKDVEALKGKVTPDEIICGIDYELKRMVDKNKTKAKELVVANLKKDPKYYSSLGMLIHSDERINESVDKEAEKKKAFEDIFQGMMGNQAKTSVRNVDSRVVDAYKDTVERLKQKRTRTLSDTPNIL